MSNDTHCYTLAEPVFFFPFHFLVLLCEVQTSGSQTHLPKIPILKLWLSLSKCDAIAIIIMHKANEDTNTHFGEPILQ